jgi:reductive dehalogenase
MDRRIFLNAFGGGSAVLGAGFAMPRLVGRTAAGVLVESEAEYGGFLVEKLSGDRVPYEVDNAVLEPMSEKANVFSRNVWDPERREILDVAEDVAGRNLIELGGKEPNQTRLDYALMAAAWRHAQNSHDYGWDTTGSMVRGTGLTEMGKWEPADIGMTWEQVSLAVRHAALFYGASLAGIAELDRRWLYSDHLSSTEDDRGRALPVLDEDDRFEQTDNAWYIPRSMNRVIALAFEEYYLGIQNSPGRLASAAVGDGYSRMAVTSSTLADFIRGLGYRALPAGNGVGLSIPMAIDAGLGQLGRLGLLITPKYGPRVRIAKVITDMPLVPNDPIEFGVTEFCDVCMLCASECPSGSISSGPRTWKGTSVSNNPGVLKWYVSPESCYDFNGFSCSNCKRSCPFNKPNNSWLHRMIRTAIEGRLRPADAAMVNLDQASGYGTQLQATEFWKLDGSKTITGREEM